MKKAYWENIRPYTKSKLNILRKYLCPFSDILFSLALKNNWNGWKTIYYVDCHAGKGSYNENGNFIPGSPLIALECAKQKQAEYYKKYGEKVRLKCIFVEKDKKSAEELKEKCELYKNEVNYEIYSGKDINEEISGIIDKIGSSPAFFFIDPGKTKHLKKETILSILSKKGVKDMMLTYIKSGPERISGIIRKNIGSIMDGTIDAKNLKTIKTLTDFTGLEVVKHINDTERERLKFFINSIKEKAGDRMEVLVYDMPYEHKSDNIYYLLFATKKESAKGIMKDIFSKEKIEGYGNQLTLGFENRFEI